MNLEEKKNLKIFKPHKSILKSQTQATNFEVEFRYF